MKKTLLLSLSLVFAPR
uniref:BabB n=1 Tax=Helicobacter pylori TaxID=210 RepID=A0A0N9EJB3_HELPX|nr:BabB [Helicobacter pylori]ALF44922.1 BabB [Helicobacter pylori]ALF44924.1 BabB [Helicobacter pylori]ALF44936.1 BabB [Helicobacter pylori]ALF44949.1 BabB [Helicobacter pylori]